MANLVFEGKTKVVLAKFQESRRLNNNAIQIICTSWVNLLCAALCIVVAINTKAQAVPQKRSGNFSLKFISLVFPLTHIAVCNIVRHIILQINVHCAELCLLAGNVVIIKLTPEGKAANLSCSRCIYIKSAYITLLHTSELTCSTLVTNREVCVLIEWSYYHSGSI